ncbi:hypothetical protein DRO30_04290 [Candidatus Bathyarchaeota archaeon]|nr:MAG: hypothetical protein DRO30_04290 [Candidatus Bathyarchaeota archaeon]
MRILALISGGIDSPVACYLMIKMGFELEYLHFCFGKQSLEKVKSLIKVLEGRRLHVLPYNLIKKK